MDGVIDKEKWARLKAVQEASYQASQWETFWTDDAELRAQLRKAFQLGWERAHTTMPEARISGLNYTQDPVSLGEHLQDILDLWQQGQTTFPYGAGMPEPNLEPVPSLRAFLEQNGDGLPDVRQIIGREAELVERLADEFHTIWSEWLQYMFTRFTGSLLNTEDRERWERQMETDYAELSEKEKHSDRVLAWRVLQLIRDFIEPEDEEEKEIRIVAETLARERYRQVLVEGFDAEHDAQHRAGALAAAGGLYALSYWADRNAPEVPGNEEGDIGFFVKVLRAYWPFSTEWFKPGTAEQNYIKAGALIMAELGQIYRAGKLGEE